jgi:hypothetical protein
VRRELRRLRTLAGRLGCCPTHMAKLVCAWCDVRWGGTDAEFLELWPLSARDAPYFDRIAPTDAHCPRHPDRRLWCEPCYEEAARPIAVPDDLFTAEERQRYDDLLGLLLPTEDRVSDHQGDPRYRMVDALAALMQGAIDAGAFRRRLEREAPHVLEAFRNRDPHHGTATRDPRAPRALGQTGGRP